MRQFPSKYCSLPFHTLFQSNTSAYIYRSLKTMTSKRPSSDNGEKPAKKPKTSGHWSNGLLDAMKDPENVVQEDDLIITIKDKYPKARFHYLVIPKEDISSLKAVSGKDQALLKHMGEVAEKIVSEDRHKGTKFNVGYHAQASMFRLHLHVISEDMDSKCVKTKKHWNSFTTNFFMDYKDVQKQLESDGKITLPTSEVCKKLMNAPLKCHKCDYTPKHMPDLKHHIIEHFK